MAADAGWLDVDAGLVDVRGVIDMLTRAVREQGVSVHDSATICGIGRNHDAWQVATDYGALGCDRLVITAGLGAIDVLDLVPDCLARFPLRRTQPARAAFFIAPQTERVQFTDEALPAFAYPEAGIYGQPIIDGQMPGVRIGLRQPTASGGFGSAADFIAACVPALCGTQAVDAVQEAWVEAADHEFIVGSVPGAAGVCAAAGWGGSLCVFAPWIGLVLAQLAMNGETSYDITRFSPARFA